jgi:hypothetical protein
MACDVFKTDKIELRETWNHDRSLGKAASYKMDEHLSIPGEKH